MSAATTGRGRERLHVTGHARQRFLQRVDAEETYPASAIRAVWDAVQNGGEAPHAAILVYDRGPSGVTILTVYPARCGAPEVILA